jgi:hypothetical protein
MEPVCTKVPHYTLREAKSARAEMAQKGKKLRIYRCGVCDHYHLGHRPRWGWLVRRRTQ